MQRQIKFRAWDTELNAMQRVINTRNGSVELVGLEITTSQLFDTRGSNPFIPLQFTGVFDRNGKEICEGDVVKWEKSSRDWIVRWMDGAYRMNATDDKEEIKLNENLFSGRSKLLEIIGNIYENPELLGNK